MWMFVVYCDIVNAMVCSSGSFHYSQMSFSPLFFHLNRSSHGWKDPAGGICGGGLGPDPSGYNSAVENVLSVDGGAACSSRKECGDRGHVC